MGNWKENSNYCLEFRVWRIVLKDEAVKGHEHGKWDGIWAYEGCLGKRVYHISVGLGG